MIKNKIFKQGTKIAEKNKETKNRWGCNENHKSLFDSVIRNHFNWVKIGICGLNNHPSSIFLFLSFLRNPYSLFEKKFIYMSTAVCKYHKSVYGV